MDRARLFHFAAAFEFYVFAVTFVVCVCILSVAAALFVVTTLLSHTFPEWQVWMATAWRFLTRA